MRYLFQQPSDYPLATYPIILDSANFPISPESLAHTYAYTVDGTLATDTCTDGTNTWVKTYTYVEADGQLVLGGETAWVRQ
jgi:hypothetical protein